MTTKFALLAISKSHLAKEGEQRREGEREIVAVRAIRNLLLQCRGVQVGQGASEFYRAA